MTAYPMKDLLHEAFKEFQILDFSVEHQYHASPIFMLGQSGAVAHNGHHDIHLRMTIIGPKVSMKFLTERFNTARCMSVTDNTPYPYYFSPDDPMKDIGRYDVVYQLHDLDAFNEELKDYEYKLYSKEFDQLMEKELSNASDSE